MDNTSHNAEVAKLKSQLEEAEQTLLAIRSGAVDALVIAGPNGDNIFTLEGSDHNYRLLIESIGEGALTTDRDGYILYCNRRFAEMVQLDPETIIGRRVSEFARPDERVSFEQLYRQSSAFSNTLELILVSDKGREIPTQVSLCQLPGGPLPGVGMILTDLTELKMAAQLREANQELVRNATKLREANTEIVNQTKALAESENRFRSLANSVAQLSWIAKPDGWISWYNDQWYDYTGTTLEEAQGWGWDKVHHPDHVDRVKAEVKAAWARGEAFEMTFPLRGKNGQFRWFLTRVVPIRDANGVLREWFGTNTDINEQVVAQQELSRSNGELARFAYIASHDLKEPLRVVSNYSQMLQLRCKALLDADSQTFIKYILEANKRMFALIDDLLHYSSLGANELLVSSVACNSVVEGALANLQSAISECGARITVGLLPVVSGDKGQLLQLFQNLIANALKYSKGPQPEIAIAAEKSGDRWVFSIKDNGIGIEPAYFDKIFVLFQRLHGKDEYSGTGIGLALCKKIVERHHGSIWVASKIGEGSTFFFSIPALNSVVDSNWRSEYHPAS